MSETNRRKVGEDFHNIRAEIISHRVWGVPANALIIKLPEASNVLSSRDGYKTVRSVCNCYLPESLWPSFHTASDNWTTYLKEILGKAKVSPDEATALSTGVNMDNLAWQAEMFEELWGLAFVTAGK